MTKICHIDLSNKNEIPVRSIEFMIKYYSFCGNFSESVREQFIQVIKEESIQKTNTLSTQELIILIFILSLFTIMILFGVFANSLVLFAVIRYRELQTARNVFILNLAISDLCLCIFTQPFNLLRMLVKYHPWNYGDVLCKMSSLLQGTNVFVSTITITAIALDRFQVIVYPTRSAVQVLEAIICLCSIWLISMLMASPLIKFSRVYEDQHGYKSCGEDDFSLKSNKLVYSIISIIVQYLVPIVIVTLAYIRIYMRIKYRMINSEPKGRQCKTNKLLGAKNVTDRMDGKHRLERRRQKRTNLLLACLALVFVLSWLPLNIINLYMSIKENNMNFTITLDSQGYMAPSAANHSAITDNEQSYSYSNFLQAGCLLLVLASACINPILYGWLNDNFRKFLRQILRIPEKNGNRREKIGSKTAGKTSYLTPSLIQRPDDQNFQSPLVRSTDFVD